MSEHTRRRWLAWYADRVARRGVDDYRAAQLLGRAARRCPDLAGEMRLVRFFVAEMHRPR